MKKLYYIVIIEPRPHLDQKLDVEAGVIVPYDEVLQFYKLALIGCDLSVEERRAEAERCRNAAESVINDGSGCGVVPTRLSEKEYFQQRLEGLQTLEEFKKSCE